MVETKNRPSWMVSLLSASTGEEIDAAFDVLLGVVQQARASGDIRDCEELLGWVQRPEVLQELHVEILISIVRLTCNMQKALSSWVQTVDLLGEELDRRSLNRLRLLWGLEPVRFFDLREEAPLRFTAKYESGDASGLVYYNVETSEVGPEEVSTWVSHRFRREVHRLLTKEGSHARALLG